MEQEEKAKMIKDAKEARKKEEEEELWEMRNEFFREQEAKGQGLVAEAFGDTMKSVFTRVEEDDGQGIVGDSELSEPSMGPLSRSKADAETAQRSTSMATPSLSLPQEEAN